MSTALVTQTGEDVEAVERPKRRPKRKLFISYRGILMHLVENQVSHSDLESGLFYFGCTRELAFDIGNIEMRTLIPNQSEATDVHTRLWKALEPAEREERAIWRKISDPSSFAQLNHLLEEQGFRPVDPPGPHYGPSTYPVVKELVIKANPTLEVVF